MVKFYKRTKPEKVIYPSAVYSDLYDNNKATHDIQFGTVDGIENNSFLIADYTLPQRPTFGDVEMVGAKLGFYINSITQGGGGGTAGLKAFKLGVEIGGAEGGKSSTGSLINNQDIVQIASYHDENEDYYAELFSNDSDTDDIRETIEMTLLKKTDPYLDETVAYAKGQNWGMLYGGGKNGDGRITSTTHKKRFGQKQEDGSYIYKVEKEKQWGKAGWKSIKKHSDWIQRNEEWWKSYSWYWGDEVGVRNDVKHFMEVEIEIAPEDQPTLLSSDNSFFETIKQTETHRSVSGESNTIKREHYCQIIHDTKNNKTGGGSMGLHALYTHRDQSNTSPQYSTYNDPTKLVDGVPTPTSVEESTLQQVAFACKRLPVPIDCGNSQTPMRAAAGTHAPIPTVEFDINFEKISPMLKRNERMSSSTTRDTWSYRLNRSFCITFGNLKPNPEDSLYTYIKRHLPRNGEHTKNPSDGLDWTGDKVTNGNGEPYQAAFVMKTDDGDLAISGNTVEKAYVILESTDGTKRVYVIVNSESSSGAVATGTVMTSGSDTGTGTLGSTIAALGKCIAVNVDLSSDNQATLLNAFRSAITNANGHNGKLICGTAHNTDGAITPANGPQYMHITQGVAGSDGNTNITSTWVLTGTGSFVRSRDTTIGTSNFVGGYDTSTFYGSAFVTNADGELCHKSLEGISAANRYVTFSCDDELGEVCLAAEPSVIAEGRAMNAWTRVSYQLHPDNPGARMAMYQESDGEFLQKPHQIFNTNTETLDMGDASPIEHTDRWAVNRDKPPRYVTMWLNNYQSVKASWDSARSAWKTGLITALEGDDDHDLPADVDDSLRVEKGLLDGGGLKSQSFQLFKARSSIRITTGDASATNPQSPYTVAGNNDTWRTQLVDDDEDANGSLDIRIVNGKDWSNEEPIFYDNARPVDEFITSNNADMEMEINIDAIRLKKFNLLHQNATPAVNNPFPRKLTIESPANLIPYNFNLNLSNTNLDSVYDHKTYQPSYLSFGFDNWYDMIGTSSAIMTKTSKKLLLNGFEVALGSITDRVIVNPNSRLSHVRAGYTSYEDRGMQCRNKVDQTYIYSSSKVQDSENSAPNNLPAGYWSTVTANDRTGMNLFSQLFDNGNGTPSYTKRGLIVGDDAGTLGTNHDISIGTDAAGQIDYFSQKGILEWKFSPRTTDSGHNTPVSTQSSTATSLGVTSTTSFSAYQYIKIVDEIMKVISVDTSTSLTVLRGQYGTTAVTVPANTSVFHIAVPEKRENIFCSSRILDIDKHTLTVDDMDILKLKDSEEFIIYKYGDSHSSPTFTPKIVRVVRIVDDRQLKLDIIPSINRENVSEYLISPYRYWLNLEILNIGGEVTKAITANDGSAAITLSDVEGLKTYQQIKDTSTTITGIIDNVVYLDNPFNSGDDDEITFETGTWQGNNTTFVRKMLPKKAYTNVVGISEKGTYGATYNESLYNDGNYINSWGLSAYDGSEESAIILKDYGFGDFNEETSLGGHAGFLPLNNQGDISKYKEIDISGFIISDTPEFGDKITLATGCDDPEERFKINVDTEDGTNPLYITTILEDEVMDKPILDVKPDKDNNFYPKFTWNRPSKDAWYGFIIVDDKNISNQYANAIMYFSLNESGPHGLAASAPTEKISGLTTIISGPLYDIEGLAGYSLNFDGANDYIRCGTPNTNINTAATNDATATATSEMSIVAHIVPDSGASDDRYIVSQEDTNGRKFSINLNSSNQVVAKVYRTDSDYVSLTSASIIPTDGELPTNIIVTVDTKLVSGNVKLFINGKLEDISGAALGTGTINNWQKDATIQSASGYVVIGNSSHSSVTLDRAFDGKIEEVVIYDKCIYPVVPNTPELLFTKPISELVSGNSLAQSRSNTAKIFIKDYHNIRGYTESEVASSPQVSWRKAGFALDTS